MPDLKVGGKTRLADVTLVLDTSAYASGDVLADTAKIAGFFDSVDGTGIIQSIVVVDEDDQGVAFDVHFLQANVSMGTVNAAPSISDANARNSLGYVSVATSDYKDLGGVRVANVKNIGLPVKAAAQTLDLYVAVVNGTGAPTFTASGVKLRIGALLD